MKLIESKISPKVAAEKSDNEAMHLVTEFPNSQVNYDSILKTVEYEENEAVSSKFCLYIRRFIYITFCINLLFIYDFDCSIKYYIHNCYLIWPILFYLKPPPKLDAHSVEKIRTTGQYLFKNQKENQKLIQKIELQKKF